MRNRSTIPIALAVTTLLSLGALTPALAQKGPGDPEPPITLRLLVQDSPGRQSEPAALDLARIAEEVSGGAIIIMPTFEGGDVATAVIAGDAELGMVPSRDWGAVGVNSLDVLEAPFLIDNDELALAVATSDIAERAMAGLNAVGVTGLAMWPEDLRHLFALNPSGADFSTLDGLADADVLVVAGIPGNDLITTLGGRIYAEYEAAGDLTGGRGTDAIAGTLEGMVTGLWGAGLPTDDVTVAGDLVVYSKYQMLVGNTGALGRLSEQQRAYLDEIVMAAHAAALERHFTESELATQLCERGGRVVALGPTAVGAFKAAAQPLTDSLAADPTTGELMAAVEALREVTPVAPGAGTCEPGAASVSEYPVSDPPGYIGTAAPPAGTYRAELTETDLLTRGASPRYAAENAGIWTWTVADDRWASHYSRTDGRCAGSFEVVGNVIRQYDDTDPTAGCYGAGDYRWKPDGDGVLVLYVPSDGESPIDTLNWQAFNDRVWTRIVDAPGLPEAAAFIGDKPVPPGSYRVEVTADQLVAAGASEGFASSNAGIWTWTFTDSRWAGEHLPYGARCGGAMTVADGHVDLADTPTDPCTFAYDLRWRLDGDGIRFELVDLNWMQATPGVLADERAFIERVWTRIEDAPAPPEASADSAAFIGDQLPPDGTYRAEMTLDALIERGASRDFAGPNVGTWTWSFGDGTWSAAHGAEQCSGTLWVEDGSVHADERFDGGCGMEYIFRWRQAEGGIEVQLVGVTGVELSDRQRANERAFLERVWTRLH